MLCQKARDELEIYFKRNHLLPMGDEEATLFLHFLHGFVCASNDQSVIKQMHRLMRYHLGRANVLSHGTGEHCARMNYDPGEYCTG